MVSVGVREVLREREELDAKKSSPEALKRAIEFCSERPTAFKLEQVWRIAWIRGGFGFHTGWTKKQKGQAREMMNILGAELAANLIAEALPKWGELRVYWKKKLGWQKSSEYPNMGLLLAGRDAAVKWAAGDDDANVCTQQDIDDSWEKV